MTRTVHGQGDECLRRVAQSIIGCLRRAGDFATRYGGDEFAALLPHTKGEEGLTFDRGHSSGPCRPSHPSRGIADGRPRDSLSCGLTTAATDSGATIVQILEAA